MKLIKTTVAVGAVLALGVGATSATAQADGTDCLTTTMGTAKQVGVPVTDEVNATGCDKEQRAGPRGASRVPLRRLAAVLVLPRCDCAGTDGRPGVLVGCRGSSGKTLRDRRRSGQPLNARPRTHPPPRAALVRRGASPGSTGDRTATVHARWSLGSHRPPPDSAGSCARTRAGGVVEMDRALELRRDDAFVGVGRGATSGCCRASAPGRRTPCTAHTSSSSRRGTRTS
jgi:hypothetical protein